MGLSIQEQLLKAGMIDKKQVKKAEHEKRMQKTKKKKSSATPNDDVRLRMQQQQAQQAKQDLELNAQRNQQAQRKADLAAARQLVATNKRPLEEGNESYHYVDGGQIKRILLSPEAADRLCRGLVGLAMHNQELVLIPAATVVKVLQRDKNLILAYNDPALSDDDYPTDW